MRVVLSARITWVFLLSSLLLHSSEMECFPIHLYIKNKLYCLYAVEIEFNPAVCRNASPGVEWRSPNGENLRRGARARGAAV